MKNNISELKQKFMNEVENNKFAEPFDCLRIFAIKITKDRIKIIYELGDYSFDWDEYYDLYENKTFLMQQNFYGVQHIDSFISTYIVQDPSNRRVIKNSDIFVEFMDDFDVETSTLTFDFINDTAIPRKNQFHFRAGNNYYPKPDGGKFALESPVDYVNEDGSRIVGIDLLFNFRRYSWKYIGAIEDEEYNAMYDSLVNLNLPLHPFFEKFIES